MVTTSTSMSGRTAVMGEMGEMLNGSSAMIAASKKYKL